jgi:hypothetical protein
MRSPWLVAFIGPAARLGLALTALVLGLLLVVQVADLRLFTLSMTVRRVVWLAAASAWLVLFVVVILRFVVID